MTYIEFMCTAVAAGIFGFFVGACIWTVQVEREWRTLIRAYLEQQVGKPLPREDESEPGSVYMPITEDNDA